jgi:hypothetical protein
VNFFQKKQKASLRPAKGQLLKKSVTPSVFSPEKDPAPGQK